MGCAHFEMRRIAQQIELVPEASIALSVRSAKDGSTVNSDVLGMLTCWEDGMLSRKPLGMSSPLFPPPPSSG